MKGKKKKEGHSYIGQAKPRQQDAYLKVDVKCIALSRQNKAVNADFQHFFVKFVLGKHEIKTKGYSFIQHAPYGILKEVPMVENMETISHFIINKKGQWCQKNCMFKVYCSTNGGKLKKLGQKPHDISIWVGNNDPQPVEIQLTNEISFRFQVTLMSANAKDHVNLFYAANKQTHLYHSNPSIVIKTVGDGPKIVQPNSNSNSQLNSQQTSTITEDQFTYKQEDKNDGQVADKSEMNHLGLNDQMTKQSSDVLNTPKHKRVASQESQGINGKYLVQTHTSMLTHTPTNTKEPEEQSEESDEEEAMASNEKKVDDSFEFDMQDQEGQAVNQRLQTELIAIQNISLLERVDDLEDKLDQQDDNQDKLNKQFNFLIGLIDPEKDQRHAEMCKKYEGSIKFLIEQLTMAKSDANLKEEANQALHDQLAKNQEEHQELQKLYQQQLDLAEQKRVQENSQALKKKMEEEIAAQIKQKYEAELEAVRKQAEADIKEAQFKADAMIQTYKLKKKNDESMLQSLNKSDLFMNMSHITVQGGGGLGTPDTSMRQNDESMRKDGEDSLDQTKIMGKLETIKEVPSATKQIIDFSIREELEEEHLIVEIELNNNPIKKAVSTELKKEIVKEKNNILVDRDQKLKDEKRELEKQKLKAQQMKMRMMKRTGQML